MKQSTTIFAIISMMFILAACGTNNAETESAPVELTDVTLQLGWIHDYSAVPVHVALNEGFFEAEGLNVTVEAGGFDEDGNFIDTFGLVKSGEVMFGVGSASRILQERDNGESLVGFLSVLQRSPAVLLALADTGLQQPADLEGLTVMASEEDTFKLEILMDEQGIDTESVTILPRSSFGIDPLLNGETDVLLTWIINEGVMVTESGNEASYLIMSDYGIDAYDSVYFATEETISNNPDVVQALVNAVTAGIEFAVANPEEAIAHTISFNEELDEEAQLRRLNAMIPLMNVPGIDAGHMDDSTWTFTYNLLHDNGIIGELDVTGAYTVEYVENVPDDSE